MASFHHGAIVGSSSTWQTAFEGIGNYWFSTLISSVLIYMAATVLHTLAIHPLRGFPGPVVAAYSRVPYWVACLRGNQVRWLQRLHSRYGPVVRYGPNDLSYTDERAWQDIFGHKKGRAENPKDKRFFGPSKNGVESMVTADIESHAKVRRILSVAFSERALRKQEPLFQKYADLMIDSIRQTIAKDPTAPLDMVRFMNFTTFDLMADLAFGEPLGLLERNEYTQWVEMIFKSIAVLPVVQITQYYPILKTLFEWLEPRSVADIRLAHFRHSTDRVDRRLSRGSNKPDIWNLVISGDGGSPLSLAEMHSNAEIFMTAGTETTATLLSGLCYLLLAHPDKMETLVKEVRGSFDSDAEISLDRLSGLGYLNACLEEGLRLYPPVPSSIPRVTPEGGNIILDEWVAPGTCVSVQQFSTYRSPTNFRNPDTFAPERWLGDPDYEGDRRDALKPFSCGPRNCLGQNMAYHEMRLLLAKLLYNFDLELCDVSRDWMDQKVYILWEKKPLLCWLRTTSKDAHRSGSST